MADLDDSRGIKNAMTRLIISLDTLFRHIMREINGRLDLSNIEKYSATITDTGTADSENTITHDLGFVPTAFIVTNIDKAGVVYASREANWTVTQIFVKCSTANTAVDLIVLR